MDLSVEAVEDENFIIMYHNCGNIDPAGTLRNGKPEQIRKETLELMEKCCKYPNLCGIMRL